MTNQSDRDFGRRRFLIRTGKAGVSIAAAGIIAARLCDRKGPEPGVKTGELVTFPDFSIQQQPGKTMSVVKGSDRVKTVNKAIELLGGMSRFVKTGEVVAIKPNVAFASPPMLGATANPELIAEVALARSLKATGESLIKTVHAHPTLSESIMEAAANAYGEAIHI